MVFLDVTPMAERRVWGRPLVDDNGRNRGVPEARFCRKPL
jgi:hypothetical protein